MVSKDPSCYDPRPKWLSQFVRSSCRTSASPVLFYPPPTKRTQTLLSQDLPQRPKDQVVQNCEATSRVLYANHKRAA